MATETIKTTTEVKSNINILASSGGGGASHTLSNIDTVKIIFKNERGSDGQFCKSWGVYFENQDYKFDTILLPWVDDEFYGDGWTQLSDSVADIIGGGFNGFVGIKNAFRVNADKLKIAMKPLGY